MEQQARPSYDSLNTAKMPETYWLRRRPSPLIRNMEKLPVEVVLDIISDCTLYKTLILVSGDSVYLRNCVLNHPGCQQLFYSEEALDSVVVYFRTYHGMSVLLQMRPSPTSPLSLNVSDKRLHVGHIKRYLHSTIVSTLEGAAMHLKVLKQWEPDEDLPLIWNSSSAHALSERFITLQRAQKYFNEQKAGQLRGLALFKEKYPDLLCTLTDPPSFAESYDTKKLKKGEPSRSLHPSPKTNHVVRRFRRDAQKVVRSQYITNRIYAKHSFRYDILPLVPHDWCLRFFCRFLDDHPLFGDEISLPDTDGNIVNGTGLWRKTQNMYFRFDQSWWETFNKRARVHIFHNLEGFTGVKPADTEESLPSGKPPSELVYPPDQTVLSSVQFRHPYPAAVAKDIRTALDGIKTVYTLPDPNTDIRPIIVRTEHTRWSLNSSELHLAYAKDSERLSELEQSSAVFARPKIHPKTHEENPGRVQPHDDRELEWLGAFCRAVEYMGGLLAAEKAVRQ